jgi:uncharacterized protein (DUF305 family)
VMRNSSERQMARAGLVLGLVMSLAGAGSSLAAQQGGMSPAEQAKADSGRPPFTSADVQFMQGMIMHHTQAVIMAGWAPSHGARPDVQRLCERIVVAQKDEIVFMQRWLRERHQAAPEANFTDWHAGLGMPAMAGMPAMGPMPGMLTAAQMTQLEAARGPDFDRLFLTFMIQHHTGALTMVDNLFEAEGAGQDGDIFKFASDVGADQTAEIDRMSHMLAEAPAASGN